MNRLISSLAGLLMIVAMSSGRVQAQQTRAQQLVETEAQLQAKQAALLVSQSPLGDARPLCEHAIDLALGMNPSPEVPDKAIEDEGAATALINPQNSPTEADLTQAGEDFLKAIELAPFWPDAYFNLGVFREHQARALLQSQPEQARLLLREGVVAFELYLRSKPGAQDRISVLARIGGLRALMGKAQQQKQINARQEAAAEATAEQQKEEADWNELKNAFAQQEKAMAIAGPWMCATFCTGGSLYISNGSISGSLTLSMSSTTSNNFGGSKTSSTPLTITVDGTVSKGVVQGEAAIPSYKMDVCTVPPSSQELDGSISDDGRSMNLQTTVVNYNAQTQGLLITTCTGVTPAGNQTIRMQLASQAPRPIWLLQAVQSLPAGAANLDQLEAIRLILSHGANVNVANAAGLTSVHLAARLGRPDLVAFLLDHGAQVDAPDGNNETPLSLAVDAKSPGTVQLLLQRGAQPAFLANSAGMTPLDKAIRANNLAIAVQLLKYTPKNQVSGALYFATDANLDATRMLLSQGADVNTNSRFGTTPLAVAILRGCGYNYVRVLSMRPRDAKHVDCSPVPVTQTISLLLDHGAKANVADESGTTLLMRAAETGDLDAVKLLIAHGASITARDDKGHSVLSYAKEGRREDFVREGKKVKRVAAKGELVAFFKSEGLKK